MGDIFVPKDLSKVSSIRHGGQQELIVRTLYNRNMQKMCQQLIFFEAGLVVNPSFPNLGAFPDGKEYNPTKKTHFITTSPRFKCVIRKWGTPLDIPASVIVMNE